MRKRPLKLSVYALSGLFLVFGCKSKVEKNLEENRPRASKRVHHREDVTARKSNLKSSRFVLQEVPIKQNNVDLPDHVLRVNQQFASAIESHFSNEGNLDASVVPKLWNSYLEKVLRSEGLMAALDSEMSIRSHLENSQKKEIYRELSSLDGGDLSIEDRENLYGGYMAVAFSASNGAGTFDQFFALRANEEVARKVDLYLYRIALSGLGYLKHKENSPRLNHWQVYAGAKNPIYRLLALQMGDQFYPTDIIVEETNTEKGRKKLHRERGIYYTHFLNDSSKFIRIEALRNIAALDWEIAQEVLGAHRENKYGEEDYNEIERLLRE